MKAQLTFAENVKLILKFIWKHKRHQIIKTTLMNKAEWLTLPNVKLNS